MRGQLQLDLLQAQSQGADAIAIGHNTGNQNQKAVTAVGSFAGQTSQGVSTVAIGHLAGYTSQDDFCCNWTFGR